MESRMGPVARSPLASRLESRSLANEDAITDRYRYRYGAFIPAPAPPSGTSQRGGGGVAGYYSSSSRSRDSETE
jgi:hypothetical protein